ncbi:MAG: ABC transporter permease DevC [Gemmataceae bacterium]
MISLAWSNFAHQKRRTAVALAGVSFAVILIFMQLGFRGSAESTATFLYDRLGDFPVFIVSNTYRDMNGTGVFPRRYLYQAMSVDEVEEAVPLYLALSRWRNVYTGVRRNILVVGFKPNENIFAGLPALNESSVLAALRRADTVTIDIESHPDFEMRKMLTEGIHHTEVGNIRVEIVGTFSLGTGFASDGAVITSDETFSKIFGGYPLNHVNVGLVKLKPGADPSAVQQKLQGLLPGDVTVWTRDQLERRDRDYWVNRKSIGILFTYGVMVALFVGVIFVYQIISSDLANQLPEYATLKAMGYRDRYLAGVVLTQALILGTAGYLPGVLVALGLYALTRAYAHIQIGMTPARLLGVFLLSIGMCALSGLLSIRRLRGADPADLY